MPIDYPETINIQDVNDEIWFDIINRTITPKIQQISEDILVQNDANSRNLGFMIQRYFENEDLSKKRIRIHYVNSLNQHDVASAHSIKVVGDVEEVVSFQWLISDKVCAEGGNIQFAIEFYNDNEEYRLFTKPTVIGVTKGICTVGEFIEPESDWFKEYSSRMNILESNMKSFNEAVENGEFDGAYALNTFANAVKGTANGVTICIDDVSPVEHTMSCKVSSKNLIPFPYYSQTKNGDSYTVDGVTYTVDEVGKLELSGTTTKGTNYYFAYGVKLEAGTYTLSNSENVVGMSVVVYSAKHKAYLTRLYSGEQSVTFTIDKDYDDVYVYMNTSTVGAEVSGYIYPQLEKGKIVTAYSSYVDPTTATVTKCGVNLLPYPYSRETFNGTYVQFIVNDDRSITLKGTPQTDTQFDLATDLKLPAGNYCLTGNGINVRARILSADGQTRYAVNTFTVAEGDSIRIYVVALANEEINYTFFPMLNFGDIALPYEDYEGATFTPNADGSVSGVKSLFPTTTLFTDNAGVVINCEYNKDTQLAIKQMLPKSTSVTLPTANWVGSISPYSQVVTMNGITEISRIDLQPTPDQLAYLQDEEVSLLTTNENGVVTVYAIGTKPTTDLTMQVMITEVISV